MAGLLHGCIDVGGRKKRKERQFRHVAFTIDGYTNEELRTRYRFGRESIMHITELLAEDLRRKNPAKSPYLRSSASADCFKILRKWQFPPGNW